MVVAVVVALRLVEAAEAWAQHLEVGEGDEGGQHLFGRGHSIK